MNVEPDIHTHSDAAVSTAVTLPNASKWMLLSHDTIDPGEFCCHIAVGTGSALLPVSAVLTLHQGLAWYCCHTTQWIQVNAAVTLQRGMALYCCYTTHWIQVSSAVTLQLGLGQFCCHIVAAVSAAVTVLQQLVLQSHYSRERISIYLFIFSTKMWYFIFSDATHYHCLSIPLAISIFL